MDGWGDWGDWDDWDDWDDDTDYHRAVGRAWVTTAFASCCVLVTLTLVVLAVFGAGVFLSVADALD
ncbi:hypothetical protein [Streptomyces sp. DH24]|uniref:hypothetical protein n=1 Tax=Streptomyces sp. DH24 TaxID=3040123 RepID=UPI0024421EAD|nr:hypothetical protein [Streptomyces sp. DH24]MDG9718534.1 hypothetical protein [Streptomyces sp. DH24]